MSHEVVAAAAQQLNKKGEMACELRGLAVLLQVRKQQPRKITGGAWRNLGRAWRWGPSLREEGRRAVSGGPFDQGPAKLGPSRLPALDLSPMLVTIDAITLT